MGDHHRRRPGDRASHRLTSVATLLMLVPFLSAIGGLVLVWVVYRLLKPGAGNAIEAGLKEAKSFRQAIFLIVAADFMMSLDNVIAVAGSAHGSIFLLIAGLLISMPLLMTAGGLISGLIDKARWLVYVGAAAISFTAAAWSSRTRRSMSASASAKAWSTWSRASPRSLFRRQSC
jgi:YjbE family integral membrane protein